MAYILEHVGLGTSQETYEPTVKFYETVFGWHRIRELEGELTFLGDGKAAASRSSPAVRPFAPIRPTWPSAFRWRSSMPSSSGSKRRAARSTSRI